MDPRTAKRYAESPEKAHFENRLPDKLRVLAKYRMLIIDKIGYLPIDIQGANLFFQWNEVFADVLGCFFRRLSKA